jgi:hypothetical protein
VTIVNAAVDDELDELFALLPLLALFAPAAPVELPVPVVDPLLADELDADALEPAVT